LGLADHIPQGCQLAFDSDAIIYFVEENIPFIETVATAFEMMARGEIQGHVSVVNLAEVLVQPLRNERLELANRYRRILTRGRNLTMHPLTATTADLAASLRARHNLGAPDAMIAASALHAGCTHLLTNDAKYRGIPGLDVLVIREHADEKGQQ
jgi:predicted nucleic acid-binding protein